MSRYKKYEVRVYDSGTTHWKLNGKMHRENGPALIVCGTANDFISYYINDRLHRLDGPAIEYANGQNVWYLYGKWISKKNHAIKMRRVSKVLAMIELLNE